MHPDWGWNSGPPDHGSTFHVTETPGLTTWPLVIESLVSVRTFGVVCPYSFSLLANAHTRADIRSEVKWAVDTVIADGHFNVPWEVVRLSIANMFNFSSLGVGYKKEWSKCEQPTGKFYDRGRYVHVDC